MSGRTSPVFGKRNGACLNRKENDMGRKPKKITVVADDYVVIQARLRAGEVIDWFTELEIRNKILRQNPDLYHGDSEFEYRMWMECTHGEELKRDPSDGKLHIYRYARWIEYRLVVRYCFQNQSYERIIECQWGRNGILEGSKLDICFYDNQPEEILWIREHRDPFTRAIIEKILHRLRTGEDLS